MIQSLPGITYKTYRYIMSKSESIRTLVNMSLENLTNMLGDESARMFHSFVRKDARK